MRWARLVLAISLLIGTALISACAGYILTTEPVMLRHRETGQTVQCGPYRYSHLIHEQSPRTAFARERACVEDYQRQGYERVPE